MTGWANRSCAAGDRGDPCYCDSVIGTPFLSQE